MTLSQAPGVASLLGEGVKRSEGEVEENGGIIAPANDIRDVGASVAEILAQRSLTQEALQEEYRRLLLDNTLEGGEVSKFGRLVRLPGLENAVWDCSPELITPNPYQPRQYFDPAKMAELRSTILDKGQREPVKAVPYYNGQAVKLFLVDGERRYRTVEDLGIPVKVMVQWEPSFRKIFETSLILNLSRADHNPMEMAEGFNTVLKGDMAEDNSLSKDAALDGMAKRLGIAKSTMKQYLRFLELDPSTQELIRNGQLPTSQLLALHFGANRGRKKQGEKEAQARTDALAAQILARKLLDGIHNGKGDESELVDGSSAGSSRPNGNGKVTKQEVMAARREALVQQGKLEEAQRLDVRYAIVRVMGALGTLLEYEETLTDPETVDIVVQELRNRGQGKPPELFRDDVEALKLRLGDMLEVAQKAVDPPPMKEVSGKPPFVKALAGKEKFFSHELRYQMACLLAQNTDETGIPLMVQQIAERLQQSPEFITNNLTLLRRELAKLGLGLFVWEYRVKSPRGTYEKVNAYRLEWVGEEKAQPKKAPSKKVQPKEVQPSTQQAVTPALPEQKRDIFDEMRNLDPASYCKISRYSSQYRDFQGIGGERLLVLNLQEPYIQQLVESHLREHPLVAGDVLVFLADRGDRFYNVPRDVLAPFVEHKDRANNGKNGFRK